MEIRTFNKIEDLDEQIILHIASCGRLENSKVIWDCYPESREEFEEYLKDNNDKMFNELYGTVQYVVIPKKEKIIGNLICSNLYIDFEYLKLCFIQAAHKCRAPIAFVIPKNLEKDLEKITSLVKEYFQEREITIYLERN